MTSAETPPPAESPPPVRPGSSRRRWLGLGIAAVLGAVAGSAATMGVAGRRRWHRSGQGLDLDAVNARIERGVRYALDRVEASAAQQQNVAAILRRAAADLWPLREQHRAARWEMRDILAAAAIDRAKLESLRAAQIQLADTASKRIAQAMADAAEVLSPEQRAKLAALAERWRRRR